MAAVGTVAVEMELVVVETAFVVAEIEQAVVLGTASAVAVAGTEVVP